MATKFNSVAIVLVLVGAMINDAGGPIWLVLVHGGFAAISAAIAYVLARE